MVAELFGWFPDKVVNGCLTKLPRSTAISGGQQRTL